jgi:hypothetical protein
MAIPTKEKSSKKVEKSYNGNPVLIYHLRTFCFWQQAVLGSRNVVLHAVGHLVPPLRLEVARTVVRGPLAKRPELALGVVGARPLAGEPVWLPVLPARLVVVTKVGRVVLEAGAVGAELGGGFGAGRRGRRRGRNQGL